MKIKISRRLPLTPFVAVARHTITSLGLDLAVASAAGLTVLTYHYDSCTVATSQDVRMK
jgi:hypothetical protein